MSGRETIPETSRGFRYNLVVVPQFEQTEEQSRDTAQRLAAIALDAMYDSAKEQGAIEVRFELVRS